MQWKCRKHRKPAFCKARATTRDNYIMNLSGLHNHEPDDVGIVQTRNPEMMKTENPLVHHALPAHPAPAHYAPAPAPYAPAPAPYAPAPAPYHPASAYPAPAPYHPAPVPHHPAPYHAPE